MLHQPISQRGTAILLCLAMVAAASMVAFGFVMAAQSNRQTAEGLLRLELARSAARAGARHALAVAVERLASPYATAEWALRDFGHPDRDAPGNPAPNGAAWNPVANTANPFADTDDSVRPESRLFFVQHSWAGGRGSGMAYFVDRGDWPWPNQASKLVSLLNPGDARWIEPGYHSANGLSDPVRFTQVPASTPDTNLPSYYDERWRPTADRASCRYRLRYAVAPVDLGGHLLWGRQLGFDAGGDFTDPVATPHEWDEATARGYAASLTAILSHKGMNDTTDVTSNNHFAARTNALLTFLGRGNSGLTVRDYLVGFAAGPTLKPLSSLSLYRGPNTYAYASPSGAQQSSTGGPASWNAVCMRTWLNADGEWFARWGMTPFGRAGTFRPAPDPGIYHESFTDCPWRVNILTAPSWTINAMLSGFLPGVALKGCVSTITRYPYDNLDVQGNPTWKATASSTAPAGAGGPAVDCPDIWTADFRPPSLPATPFAGFTAVDYSYRLDVDAGTYAGMYPGPPADFEDYAAVELQPALRNRPAIDTHMLGVGINVFNLPGSNPGGWTQAASLDPEVPSIMSGNCAAGGTCGLPAGDPWSGEPIEPMRGSASRLNVAFGGVGSRDNVGGDRVTWSLPASGGSLFHRDSYWWDLATAMAETVTLAKALHQDAAWVGAEAVPAYVGTVGAPPKPTSVRDLDRLFLSLLGEWFPGDVQTPGSTVASKPSIVMVSMSNSQNDDARLHLVQARSRRYLIDFTCSANIRAVAKRLTDLTLPDERVRRKTACMERVLNDMRMSFFGAGGGYASFRPFDLDGDGYACASCYTGSSGHPALVLSNGQAIPAAPATAGEADVPPPMRFSLTGYFSLDKVRYVRALVRGQIWDELRAQSIAEANLDTVFAVDPDGTCDPSTGNGLTCRTLYQRWIDNLYAGEAPRSSE